MSYSQSEKKKRGPIVLLAILGILLIFGFFGLGGIKHFKTNIDEAIAGVLGSNRVAKRQAEEVAKPLREKLDASSRAIAELQRRAGESQERILRLEGKDRARKAREAAADKSARDMRLPPGSVVVRQISITTEDRALICQGRISPTGDPEADAKLAPCFAPASE